MPSSADTLERAGHWLLRAALASAGLLVLILVLAVSCSYRPRGEGAVLPSAGTRSSQSADVLLVIDFGDGVQHRFRLPHSSGMTVLDAMRQARSGRHALDFNSSGRDATAMITRIADLSNGSSSSSSAWQYWINERYGRTSVGAAALQPGDRVSWAFREYRPDPGPPPE